LACDAEELERYLEGCVGLERAEFFSAPRMEGRFVGKRRLMWESPWESGFKENDVACAEVFWSFKSEGAPTVFLLHALMSAHPLGYWRLAKKFNFFGWNAVFLHLPFHYSRRPRGYANGALAVTANLVRNAGVLRQAVMELRQVKRWFWERGSREFGILGVSYGGWVSALASSVEEDWKFVVLVQPVSDVEHAIWESPASRSIRRILRMKGIERGATERHGHLTAPAKGNPMCELRRILLCGGRYDSVSPMERLRWLAREWGGCEVLEVPQGHFGYTALNVAVGRVFEWLAGEEQEDLATCNL
ncbi:MAG: alpha/beta hydrolase, partial [Chthoniobacterales bacterium]|nr:alpha/beta hydrolase [Chthoniobacterales bacterium]